MINSNFATNGILFRYGGLVIFQQQANEIGVKSGEYGLVRKGGPIDIYLSEEKDKQYIIISVPKTILDVEKLATAHLQVSMKTDERAFSLRVKIADIATQYTEIVMHVKIPVLNPSFFAESLGQEVEYLYELAE